jgi:preprotein translocase subunit SecE
MAKEQTRSGPAAWYQTSNEFLSGVRGEFRKVTWPQRKETVAGTIGVLVVVAVITFVLGVVDVALAELVRFVLP